MQRSDSPTTEEVIRLLRNKVNQNPGDLDAALMLGSKLYHAGDFAGSAAAFKSVLKHNPQNFQALLLLARTQSRRGDNGEALKVFACAQRINPSDVQVWQVAAAVAAQIRDWRELLRIARGWSSAHPNSDEAWLALSRAYFEESQFSKAITAYARVLELKPDNPITLIGAARLEIAAQHYEQARSYLDAAKQINPESADLHYTLGRLHHLTGALDVAEVDYRRAIKARPGFATAFVELGTLLEGRLADEEIRNVNQLFNDLSVHPEYRVMLGFTLGEALDRRNECEQAFIAWDKANTMNRALSEQEGFVYSPKQVEREHELLGKIFSNPAPADSLVRVSDDILPIFVVGMPRSGTTLVESILASHCSVYGAGELPTLYDIHEELMAVARARGFETAQETIRHEASSWRERYLKALPDIANVSHVVDKQPLNFRAIGLIRLLFPDSPIIYTSRSPMDVGLSIYRHKFAKNWPCAHSLGDIGHYYGFHGRMVKLWQERFAEAIHTVHHSALLVNPEAEIRKLLLFAGLTEEPACFSPHKTKRTIATFSSVQVRHPISSAYSNRSAPYSNQLAPLYDALLKSGVDVASDKT